MPSPYGRTVGGLLSDYAGGIFETNPNAMTLLPIEVSDEGGLGLALPQIIPSIANEVYDAVTLPGDVYSGKREPTAEEALRFTGTLAGGGLLAPVPKNSLRIFGGPTARTANKPALKQAQKMELDGSSENEIIAQTGWFKGADDKWRFEIDDSKASLAGAPTVGSLDRQSSIRQVIDHDELFKAYPELADIRPAPIEGKYVGAFMPAGKIIDYDRIGINPTRSPEEIKGTALHEIQHAIQKREGFARGGNPDEFVAEAAKAMDDIPVLNKKLSEVSREIKIAEEGVLKASGLVETALAREKVNSLKGAYESVLKQKEEVVSKMDPIGRYLNQAGEVEARNVQARIDMTPKERASVIPRTTEDRSRSAQEIRFDRDDVMSAYDRIISGEID
jgi:hypothetical protein